MSKTALRLFAITVVAILLSSLSVPAQDVFIPESSWKEYGEPFIRNYTPKEYGADVQNWGVAQDDQGIMYFANNDGLLEYDGVNWRLHSPGAYAAVRSIAVGHDGKVYAGFEADFGYFEADSIGDLKFTSLSHLVDEKHGEYYDFWFTIIVQDTVYFMSQQLIFRWENDQLSILKPPGEVTHAFKVGRDLYFRRARGGLSRLEGDAINLIPSANSFSGQNGPFMIYPTDGDKLLIGTYSRGLLLFDYTSAKPFPTRFDRFLRRKRIYTSIPLSNGLIAIGTQFGGVAIIDNKGSLYKIIDKRTGLQDNSIWAISQDNQGALWLGLNKGISRVELASPLSRYSSNSGLEGVVESVHRHEGTLYAATSEGVHYLDYEPYEAEQTPSQDAPADSYVGLRPVFKSAHSMNQYSFCFLSIDKKLLTGTTNGIFLLQPDRWEQILEGFTGGWQSVFQLSQARADRNLIYIASRQGIGMLRYNQGQWQPLGWVKDFRRKLLSLQEDRQGRLWVSTIDPGITLVEDISSTPVETYKFPAKITYYDTTFGLPNEPLKPLSLNNQIIFQSSAATWRFDENRKTFYQDTTFRSGVLRNKIFSYKGYADDRQRLWVGIQDKPGRVFPAVGLPMVNQSYQWITQPFLRIQDATAIISIYPESHSGKETAWTTSEILYRYDPQISQKYDIDYPALIRKVVIDNDSTIFQGHGAFPAPAIAYDKNSIRFEFAATSFDQESENQFRTMLEGFDKRWSGWSSQTRRDYTNLPTGDYRFLVQANNIYGHPSKEAAYHFEILAPWYLSWWMYLVYTLLIGGAIFSLVQLRVRQLEKKSRDLEEIVSSRTRQVVEQRNRLKAQSEKLQEMDRLKSRFFANISHEFRTPLTLILGLLNKYMKVEDTPPTPSDYSIMHRNASRLLQLINQLLDLVKLEAGGMQLQAEKQDIVQFLRRIVMSFSSMGERKNIKLLFNNSPVTAEAGYSTIFVYFEPDKLEKVFYNLLSNAFKFTPQDGKIEVTVAVGMDDDKNSKSEILNPKSETSNLQSQIVEVSVRNNGPGIPANKLPYIFDRFYQAEDSSSHEFEGTGIGLSLVKELVDLHSGHITAESIENDITTFTIQLPLGKQHLSDEQIKDASPLPTVPIYDAQQITGEAPVSAKPNDAKQMTGEAPLSAKPNDAKQMTGEAQLSPQPNDAKQITGEAQPSAQPNDPKQITAKPNDNEVILIAEDHHDLRDFIRSHLDSDYQILEAENGRIGWEIAEEKIPDLIISDIMMPEMNGYDFCAAIKTNEKTSHIPVILLTAKAARDEKMEGLETGADDYLIKPFDPEELKLRVRNLMKTRRQMREKFGVEMLLKPKEVSVPSSQKQFLERLTTIIEEGMGDENFGVEILGEQLGMSRSQIHRKLKAITNQSASEFIRNFRLQRAAELILQDAGNIAEIAYQVGFNSQAYFTRSFKDAFGCSPREYKRKHQNVDN